MAVYQIALFSLLLPAVIARPQMGQWGGHGGHAHKARMYQGVTGNLPSPSGIHGAPPLHGHGSQAPQYPAGNSTSGAATATGTGTGVGSPSTVQSTITVVPQPVNSQYPGLGTSQGGVSPNSPVSAGHGGSPNSPQSAGNGQCGGTVTITTANTVTVTVGAMGASPSAAPTQQKNKQPVSQGQGFPQGGYSNAPEGQGPGSSTTPVYAAPSTSAAVKPVQPPESSAAPYTPAEQSQPPEHSQTPEHSQSPEHSQPPVQSQPPQQPQSAQPSQPSEHSQQSPPQSQTPASSAVPSSTSASSPAKVSAKGILYSSLPSANAMSGMSWGCNWDSNPNTATGANNGNNLNYQYVPQMWGMSSPHTELWKGNSGDNDKYPYVMSFNEPNQPAQANLSPSAAIPAYISTVGWNKQSKGQKITTPCVSNDANSWMTQFLDGLKSGGSWDTYKPDCLCFHWYGKSLEEVKGVVSTFKGIQSKYDIPELWMAEWALETDTGSMGGITSDNLKEVLDWLDNGSGIDRHAYNHVGLEQSGLTSSYCS